MLYLPAALFLQNFQCLGLVAGSDHAVGNLAGNQLRRGHVAHVAQGDEIAEGGHAIRAARAGIGIGQRRKLQISGNEIDLAQARR